MRPKGTRKYFDQRLTAKEKRKIVARTRAGEKQVEIARRFGCCVHTIREVQRAAGLQLFRPLTPEVEKEVVELLRRGIGQNRVSKLTRVSERKVRAIMRKHGIHHKVGGLPLPQEKHARIAAAVLRREDYCIRISEKYNVSKDIVRRIAHEIHGPGRLLGFPVWPPMSSYFPQKHFDVKTAGPEQYVQLVQRVLEKSCDGKFPFGREHDVHFIAAMLACFQHYAPMGRPKSCGSSGRTLGLAG